MLGLAALRLGDGLDVLRPLPAGLDDQLGRRNVLLASNFEGKNITGEIMILYGSRHLFPRNRIPYCSYATHRAGFLKYILP